MTYRDKFTECMELPNIPGGKEGLETVWCPHDFFDPFLGRKMCDDGAGDESNCVDCWSQKYNGEPAYNMFVSSEAPHTDIPSITISNDDLKKVKGGPDSLKTEDVKEVNEPGVWPKVNPYIKPKIQDSGNRREFPTGAVRDIHEGKGRCDLLPLDTVGCVFPSPVTDVIRNISAFQNSGAVGPLYDILRFHHEELGFKSTADMMLEVAIHFEDGCKKYGENNWRKGIPAHCYIDSAVRHYLKFLHGDADERHDRAFVWNILCCIWTCVNMPELNDYSKKEESDGAERDL